LERIEKYIESICNDIEGSTEEINNLKDEMKSHLQQIVKELVLEGKDEEESITIALERFGEKGQVKEELSSEFKTGKKLKKRTILIASIVIIFIIGSTLGYENLKVSKWNNSLIAPEGIMIRDKFDAPLIQGTATFQGQITTYDKEIINKFITSIKNSKYKRVCSDREAYNMDIKKIKFSIGSATAGTEFPVGSLGTANIFNDGTFIASENINNNDISYHVKGKLNSSDLEYIQKIYKKLLISNK